MKRIVIKIGSNVLTRDDGTLDITRMSAIVDQISILHRKGMEIIVVTSGAVACGKAVLGDEEGLDKVEQRQLYSAVGQVRLMREYSQFFRNWGINIGQVLTMKEDFTRKEEYTNLHQCVEIMLRNNVIPVMNENDTVCVTELMFTDNDELSGLTAEMLNADTLVILSNIDGLFDSDPASGKAGLIRRVAPGDDIAGYISDSRSPAGRGGMASKCKTALSVSSKGIRVIIANGRRNDVLTDLVTSPDTVPHTEFIAK